VSGLSTRSWIRLVAGVALLVAGIGALATGTAQQPPSLMLVTVSGLRSDVLGPELTPELWTLSGGGSSLQPVMTASPAPVVALGSLMTGRDPDRLGMHFGDIGRVPPDAVLMSERLREAGYRCEAYVGQAEVSWMSGLLRGFDRVVAVGSPFSQAVLPDEASRVREAQGQIFGAVALADTVAGMLRGLHPGHPNFIWVHLGDPAAVLLDPDAVGEGYRQAVARVDQAVGLLRRSLESSGMAGRDFPLTVVSLHGEGLGAEGELRHGVTLSPPVAEVPWIPPGETPDRPPAAEAHPLPLAAVHDELLARLGLQVEPRGPRPDLAATWLPARLYGWPDQALVRGAAGWSRAPQTERFAAAGLQLDLPEVPPGRRAAVLEQMAAGQRALVAQDIDATIEAFATAADLAPQALAPRLALVRLITRLPGEERTAAAERLDVVLAEMEAIAGERPVERLDLARALARAGRESQALDLAMGLEPEGLAAGPSLALARLLADLGRVEPAVEIALDLAAEDGAGRAPELHEWAGDRLARMGSAYRARQHYERAASVESFRTANLLAKLGTALGELGDAEQALGYLAQAAETDPGYRYPHLKAGEILLAMGHEGAATHAFVQSVPATGRNVLDALARAALLEQYGLVGPAVGELAAVASSYPHAPRLQITLARLLTSAGAPERAREVLSGLGSRAAQRPDFLVEQARLAAQAGREREALELLERAEPDASAQLAFLVRRDPLFARAGEALARRAAGFGPAPEPTPTAPTQIW
jgi:tetratricopeptide (TPR) repeat protein